MIRIRDIRAIRGGGATRLEIRLHFPAWEGRVMWPVFRQFIRGDLTGLGETAFSERTKQLKPRTQTADNVVQSVCPYCAVGCGQLVYVKDKQIIDIEEIGRAHV